MAPGACRTQGWSCPGWLQFRKFWKSGKFAIWVPRASFGVIKTIVLALLGGNMNIEIHVYLISMAEFTHRLNMRVCPHIQKVDSYGRICLKVGTRIFTNGHEIFSPPPTGSPERARGSKDLPKTSPGDKLYIYIYIYSNSRSTARRLLPV